MQVLFIANFDSGVKYAGRLADAAEALGADVRIRMPSTVAPGMLSESQAAAATRHEVHSAPWPELVREARGVDALVPVFDGPRIQRFVRDVHESAGGHMPAVGAGYVGLVLNDVVSGYLMRSLADVVAVNSRTDLATFRVAAAALGLPESALLLEGLALLPARPAEQRGGPIRRVLFADQPTVPGRRHERVYLWDRLLAYARLHPDRDVRLRPRHRPHERTLHRMDFSPDVWAGTRDLPPNLTIDHRPIQKLMADCDLLLTVSSTAALEAVAAGIRVAFVADSVNDAALNPPLLPSGLLRRFDDVDADRIGSPAPEWIADVFPAQDGAPPAERFMRRLLDVAASDDRPHEAAWASAFHTGRRRTDAALDALQPSPSRRGPRRLVAGALRRTLRVFDR